jgi:hypothetical protein
MNEIKKELTPELKARLSAYRAIKPRGEMHKYIPRAFKEAIPLKECPVFTIRQIPSSIEVEGSYNQITEQGTVEFNFGKYKKHLFSCGVIGWTNPLDVFGIDFKPEFIEDGKLTESAINLFPAPLIIELADAVTMGSNLTEDELLSL